MQNDMPLHAMPRLSRRWVLTAGLAVAATGGGLFAARWYNILGDLDTVDALSVEQAYSLAEAGEIYLIDIRRPDEWDRTGVAAPAIALDMRRNDFEQVLQGIFDASGSRPVALICARGVRSDRMNTRLQNAGFNGILDVPEGMLGSGAGPGYLRRELPLRQPTNGELQGDISSN